MERRDFLELIHNIGSKQIFSATNYRRSFVPALVGKEQAHSRLWRNLDRIGDGSAVFVAMIRECRLAAFVIVVQIDEK
jgi:hypothetical protein